MKMKFNNRFLILIAAAFTPAISFAAELQPLKESVMRNPLFLTLLISIGILAIMVMVLSNALRNIIGSDLFTQKMKEKLQEVKPKSPALFAAFSILSFAAHAQETANHEVTASIGGLDLLTFYTMIIVIALELLVIFMLFKTFRKILGTLSPEIEKSVTPKVKTRTILDKLNDTVEIEKEGQILLDHDYDGIKELDNNLPPWWKYGFYLTILVAVVYLLNYHVLHFSPLQADEYKASVKKAESEIAEYMKTSANNVDESSVKELTDAKEIANGRDLFLANCAACHGRAGEGTVGPNLTDDYWLHSGSVKDIFKTIKYGWPDKGMKSWKEDLSAVQIAQVTSFIRSLKGTNPPKAKEKQGDLYSESSAPSDSTHVKTDSVQVLSSSLLPPR
jgi:cytochrome c oxidase cbb3-type subunit 3